MTAAQIVTRAIKTSIRENRIVRIDAEYSTEIETELEREAEDSVWTQDAEGAHDVLDAWGTTEEGHEWRVELERPEGTEIEE